MDIPTPSGPGPVVAPQSAAVTSHTLYPGANAEVDYDQTIKFKTPGSGMTVFSRYKLERVLGRGGMGVVWLADDLKLERPVALKFLPSLIGLDPAAVKELKTETRRGLELSHPHIVRIYDFVDDEDAAAISMEFVDGKTLSELRMSTEFGVFTVDEISKWLLGVCDALDYAHFQRKLIHRDLKPANIMLTSKEGVAKIADFGIARSLSDTMSRLSVANLGTSGTLPYMSPQQAMGERPQPTDDVYSLGATLYELLTGKPPFYRGDLPTQINSKIPPSVQERRKELEISSKESIPKLWEDAIAACLHKEPTLRPSCAGALAETLGLKPMTVTVRTGAYATATPRTVTQKAGSRAPLIAAAATVIVGAGAAALFFVGTPPLEDKSQENKNAPVAAASTGDSTKETEPTNSKPTRGDADEEPAVANKGPANGPAPATDAVPPTTPGDTPPGPVVSTTPASGSAMATTPPEATGTAPSMSAASGGLATPSATAGPLTADTPLPGVVANPQSPAGLPAAGSPGPVAGTSPQMPQGGLSLVPDPTTGATSGALATGAPAPAAATPPAAPPLPPGMEAPAGGLILTQPVVAEPTSGFWTLEQVFPVPPHASFTAKGKRHLLFRTQSLLKEKGLYTATVDGEEGKSTHNAIVLFQVRSGLQPNGLLDLPTLAALQLSAEPDKADWTGPSGGGGGGSSGGGGRRRTTVKEEPGFLQKTGDTLKRLNPFGK